MSLFRSLSASLLSALVTFSIVTASGCGTSAVGVDDCRSIEQARCRAGQHCGLVTDVDSCERFYRDHCLHGLVAKPPAGSSVSACVKVIEAAGDCASVAPDTALEACDPVVTERRSGLRLACDVVATPEKATECAFLLDQPIEDDGSGGQPATGDDEPEAGAGAAGQAGQAGQGGSPAE